ncbi:hypothetical protein [Brevibacterium sp.]|uniref:hypothetical protein n=1 Tax=Brevibacterium sp. TaxID=1701 RepID=UPI0028120C97|nr:hypothetical protein [Brevibacterium sp.]
MNDADPIDERQTLPAQDLPRCKHCGRSIVRYFADFTNGWIHTDGLVWCRMSMAAPEVEESPAPADSDQVFARDADTGALRIYEIQRGSES